MVALPGLVDVLYQFNDESMAAISLTDGSLVKTSPTLTEDGITNIDTVTSYCAVGPDGRIYGWGTASIGGSWWASIDGELNGPWVNGPIIDDSVNPINSWAGGAAFIGNSIVAVGDKLHFGSTFEFVGMEFPDPTSNAHTNFATLDQDDEGDVRSTYSTSSAGDSVFFASGGRWANRLSLTGFSRAVDSWVVAGEPLVIVSAALNVRDNRVYAYGVNGEGVLGNPSATDAIISCSLGGSDVRVEHSWVRTLTYDEGYGFESSMLINGDYIYFCTTNDFFRGGIIHRYHISTGFLQERWTHVAEGHIATSGIGQIALFDPTDLSGSLKSVAPYFSRGRPSGS